MLGHVTKERFEKISAMLEKRQPDLSVLAENVHKPHNLSAILRSCDAVGIGVVHAVHPTGGVPTFNETSASADKWVELKVHASLSEARAALGNAQLLAAHFSDGAQDYRDVDYTVPTCILMGNEKHGVSEEASARADAHIVIPMLGMVQSLNVSVAAAVILFEAQRQRREAGFYEVPRLSEAERQRLAFGYLHPRRAAQLNALGRPFPALDEDGDIMPSAGMTRSQDIIQETEVRDER
jgi:tRNA (guanosine-2'-O-)-methyltransferase